MKEVPRTPNLKWPPAILAALALALLPHAHAADLARIRAVGNLRVGYATEVPGFVATSSGRASGFAVTLMDQLARDMKIRKVTWVKAASPARLIEGLRAGSYDAVIDPNLPSPLSDVDLSRPLACTGGVILARPKGPASEAELKGRRVAAVTGSSYFYYVRNLAFDKRVNVFASESQALLGFLSGIEALVTDRFSALEIFRRTGRKQFQVSELLWSQDLDLVVAHSPNKEFIGALNPLLKKMQQGGSYAKLSESVLGQDVQCVI